MRSLLPRHLQEVFFKKGEHRGDDQARDFPLDAEFNPGPEQAGLKLPSPGRSQYIQEQENLFHWRSLSPREQEVVALVCMGQRNYQIAGILGIAHGTVKSHLENIFRKFNLRDRHSIRLALRDWDFPTWWENRHLLPTPLPSHPKYR